MSKESDNPRLSEYFTDHRAVVVWTVQDIQNRKPDWDNEKCMDFLKDHEDEIQDRMTEAGWDIIDYILDTEHNEENN